MQAARINNLDSSFDTEQDKQRNSERFIEPLFGLQQADMIMEDASQALFADPFSRLGE